MVKRLVIVAFLTTGVWQSHAQTTLVEDSIFCSSLGRVKAFRVLTPPRSEESSLRPALVLLHGFGGNYRDWTDLTSVEQIVDSLQLVVIMPDGENSWYVNSVSDPDARCEDYVVEDLIPALSQRFDIDTTKMGIAGLSMGGYGSLVLGLRHPGLFRFIGAMSSSLDIPVGIPLLEEHGRGGLKASLVETFGEDRTLWKVYDPFRLLLALDPGQAPYVYLVTGVQDEFAGRLTYHRSFVQVLSTHGFPYEYHETPGKHNWDFWAREIKEVIAHFMIVVRDRGELQ
jgi:putative tributyrin esterase